MWRMVWASIFWLTSTNSLKRVNRNTPFSVNASKISIVHLSATPPLGMSLGAAFCGVWVRAAENVKHLEQARREFDNRPDDYPVHQAEGETSRGKILGFCCASCSP